jgi:hypothetical protein
LNNESKKIAKCSERQRTVQQALDRLMGLRPLIVLQSNIMPEQSGVDTDLGLALLLKAPLPVMAMGIGYKCKN